MVTTGKKSNYHDDKVRLLGRDCVVIPGTSLVHSTKIKGPGKRQPLPRRT